MLIPSVNLQIFENIFYYINNLTVNIYFFMYISFIIQYFITIFFAHRLLSVIQFLNGTPYFLLHIHKRKIVNAQKFLTLFNDKYS